MFTQHEVGGQMLMEIPSPSHPGGDRLPVRRLAGLLVGRMGQIPAVLSGDAGEDAARILPANRRIDLAFNEKRAMNGVAMNTFTIDANNNITAYASLARKWL